MGPAVAIAALAVTAASTYQQMQAADDAADAREEAQDIGLAQGQNRERRQRRQQVREERIRRARIIAASENTGVSGSSSAIGSLGALGTNTASNMGFLSAEGRAATGIGDANQDALDAQSKGQMWAGIGELSGTVFAASGGFSAFGGSGTSGEPSSQPTNFTDEIFTF